MEVAVAQQVVDDIFDLYEKYGAADYIGEPVSQLEHMSQAADLAIRHGADEQVVLAAFFHDIGHICVAHDAENSMGGFGTMRHEQVGAQYLRRAGFPEKVAELVELHVQAKRYLTFAQPLYLEKLSAASLETLRIQGGPMTPEEASRFELNPLFRDSLMLRGWDELAKEVNVPVNGLASLRELALNALCA